MKKNISHSMKLRATVAISASICLALVLSYVWIFAAPADSSSLPSSGSESSPASSQAPRYTEVSLVAAGDNLIHNTIYLQAAARTGGKGYDFWPAYEHVESLIKGNDFAVLNQETVLAGGIFPLSNYPRFNSPTEVGDVACRLGFNVITHANNHILDQGEKGLEATLDYWSTKSGVSVIGAFRNDEDLNNIRVVEKKGVKIAFIGIAEQTNGLSLPKNSPYRILLSSDEVTIQQQIAKAKTISDLVVTVIHWGNEYVLKQNSKQEEMAQKLADWGTDLIIGHHPHVLQPIETITSADGRSVPVYYSLGNFISTMINTAPMLGGIADIRITKNETTGETAVTSVKLIPIITHYYTKAGSDLTIYPLADYTPEMAAAHGVKGYDATFSYERIMSILNETIDPQYLSMEGAK